MPYIIEKHKEGKKTCFSVVNTLTKEIHAKCTTKKKAEAQIKLLHMLHSESGKGLIDTFNPDDKKSPVELISFDKTQLTVPKYFIKQMKNTKAGKRKFKLVIPTTKARNLSTKGGKKSINLIRASIDGIELEPAESIIPVPTLDEFSKADRFKIIELFDEIQSGDKTEHIIQQKPKPVKKTKTPSPSPVITPPEQQHEAQETPQQEALEPTTIRGKILLDKEEALKRKIASKKESAKRIYREKKIGKYYKKPQIQEQNEFAIEEIRQLKGRGLFRTLSKAKKVVVGAVNSVVNSGEHFVNAIINPNSAYPPNVNQMKNEHGNDIITRLILRRNPVSSVITDAMNMVSLGSFYKKMGREPYDKLFHLSLLVVTSNGGFLLEKTERVNVSKDISLKKGTEELEIDNIPANLTVRELIENTEKEMGSNFLPYNPMNNNCQVFILNVLKANGLLNSTYEQWIKQNTDALFKNDPFLLSLSNKLVDIGKIGNVISQGGNLISNGNIHTMHHRIPQSESLINLQIQRHAGNMVPEALEAGKELYGQGIGRFVHGLVKKGSHAISTVEHAVAPVVNTVQDAIHVANQVGAMPGQVSSAVGNAMDPENLSNAGHEVAQILYRRGLPMTASTLGYIAGSMAGGPVGGIALGTAASYGTSRAVNEYQPKGLGLYAGHGEGLYAGGAIGLASPRPTEMKARSTVKRVKVPIMDGMDGGRLVIDRPITIRGIAHSINDIPKTVTKTANILAGAGLKRKGKFAKGSQEAKDHMAKIRGMKKK